MAVGRASYVTSPADVAELERLWLDTWMPDPRVRYVRIRVEQISGRLLDGQRPFPPW